jgi:hypothetical protein
MEKVYVKNFLNKNKVNQLSKYLIYAHFELIL